MTNTKKSFLLPVIIILLIIISVLYYFNIFSSNTILKSIDNIFTGSINEELSENPDNIFTGSINEELSENPDLDIIAIENDGLKQDIFNECGEYVSKKENNQLNLDDFWNSQLEDFDINFSQKLDCKISIDDETCIKLKTMNKKDKFILKDIEFMLYGIYTNNFTYDDYSKNISNINNLSFIEEEADLLYSEYYGVLMSGKINKENDCVNFLHND